MVKLIGAVLVGGTSSRMGSDKALIDVGGRPLAQHGIDALVAAGIADVMLVGATAAHGEQLSGRVVDDLWPGDGPVGGLLSALHHGFLAGASHVVGLACDLPAVTGADVVALIGAWAEAAVTLVHVEGRPAPRTACGRPGCCHGSSRGSSTAPTRSVRCSAVSTSWSTTGERASPMSTRQEISHASCSVGP